MKIVKNSSSLPNVGSKNKAALNKQKWLDSITELDDEVQTFVKEFFNDETSNKLIDAVFSNSPYLTNSLIKETNFFRYICNRGFDEAFQTVMESLKNDAHIFDTTENLMSFLRNTKTRISLLIALADISNSWNLEKITSKLSEFAESSIKVAVKHLLIKATKERKIILSDVNNPEKDSGLIMLALGKLGGQELNYSSDIDLIIFYDETKIEYIGRKTISHFFVKFTQDFTKLLHDKTKDGYVFRVDLRLRPDPGSTQAAISLSAAKIYYENLGQNWERAAMIKCRPIAGDTESCKDFMDFINSFTWQRSLDFGNIEDIHALKRQIDNKQGRLPKNLYGYNVKLGRGGIREIEFFVQTQQLIWGGRRPLLRNRSTCESLQTLVDSGEVRQETCDELTNCYRFLRKIEHRLQMVNNNQVHNLPYSENRITKLAAFIGYSDAESFISELSTIIATVQEHYARLFEDSPSLASITDQGGSLVFTGSENDPETIRTLESMGFEDGNRVSETIRGWHHGRYKSTHSKRAREILTRIMPELLTALTETANSDTAFLRFDDFLKKLSSGVHIFSLFQANPKLLDLIADIMGGYPFIADNLSRKPYLLDYVLAPEFYTSLPDRKNLTKELNETLKRDANNLEDVLEHTKYWTHDRQFRVGIQLIEKRINSREASIILSNIADVVLRLMLDYVRANYEKEYGKIEGSSYAIIALGKLGGKELTLSSDLDLVFIYDTINIDDISDGKLSLTASEYFARLTRKLINALTSLTIQGKLYDIDLRLRPSGNDGPTASKLKAFDRYYGTEQKEGKAWAWEYMALTRARVITTDEQFSNHIMNIIKSKLQKKWDNNNLVSGVLNMHEKSVQANYSDNPFNIKHMAGGLTDLEYIIQFLQLKHANNHRYILDSNSLQSLKKLSAAKIIDDNQSNILINANMFYLELQNIFRLTGNESPIEYKMTKGMKKTIVQQIDIKDFSELKKKLVTTQENVQNIFDEIICYPVV